MAVLPISLPARRGEGTLSDVDKIICQKMRCALRCARIGLRIDNRRKRAYQWQVMRNRITSLSDSRLGAAGRWLGVGCFLLLVSLAAAQSAAPTVEETQKQFLRGE